MIKRDVSKKDKSVKVTFSTPDEGLAVAGDFNGWDAEKGRMQKRSNGAFSMSVTLAAGKRYQFRYVSENGTWYNEAQADAHIDNGLGSVNSVLVL